MEKVFCEECLSKKDYYVTENIEKEIIDGKEITYSVKSAFCNDCHTELYVDKLMKSNIIAYQDAVREITGLIKVSEVNDLLNKYDISAKSLSKLLGWGEISIIRYSNGSIPERMYSNKLKELLNDSKEMEKLLFCNKNAIGNLAYRKCKAALKEIDLTSNNSKIYITSKTILAKNPDITNLALQKILYFLQGFSCSIFEKPIFKDMPEVWCMGPVYPDIYHRYSSYQYDPIQCNNVEVTPEDMDSYEDGEYELINFITDVLGIYSGSLLANMSHKTSPWKDNQSLQNKPITLTELKKYFDEVTSKYHITLGDKQSLNNYIESLKNDSN